MITKREIQKQMRSLAVPADKEFAGFLDAFDQDELFDRRNFAGHITVSGAVIHLFDREILLLHHKELDRWLLPGGHVDFDDKSIVSAVFREMEEETGLTASQLIPMNEEKGEPYCVGINSHRIPHNPVKNEAGHVHHDFRFIFGYSGDKNMKIDSYESFGYKWVPLDDSCMKQLLDVPVDKIVIDGLEKYEQQFREKHGNEYLATPLAWYQCNVAESYMGQNRMELAERMYLSAIRSFEKTYNDAYETPPDILSAIAGLSELYDVTNRFDLEMSVLEKGLEISEMYAGWDENFNHMVLKFRDAMNKTRTKMASR